MSGGISGAFDEDDLEPRQRSTVPADLIRGDFLSCFGTPAGESVLAYLYDFCRGGMPTFIPGQPDLSAYNEGKRRVLLQIMGYLQMDDEELFRIARSQARARRMEAT